MSRRRSKPPRPSEAELLAQSLRHDPANRRLAIALTSALVRAGDLPGALEAARHVLELGEDGEAWAGVGNLLDRLGRRTEALGAYQRAVELAPEVAEARLAYGTALGAAGDVEAAGAEFARAVELAPEHPRARVLLANACLVLHQTAAAYEHALAAVALDPEDVGANAMLAQVLTQQGATASADHYFERAESCGGGAAIALRRALAIPPIARSEEHIVEWRRTYERRLDALTDAGIRLGDPLNEVGMTAFGLAYHNLDDRPVQEKLARLYLAAGGDLEWTAPHCRRPRPAGSRLRIGFISGNLRHHTIGKVNAGLIEQLDRDRFEVAVIQCGIRDATADRIAAAGDTSVRLGGSLPEMRRQVAELELDVLFYTDIGMDPVTYFLAFSRLAPVQSVTWGHPDTTGIPNVDYFVSSSSVEPPGAQALYSERLVLLPQIPTYYRRPEPGPLPGREALPLAADEHVYACPQSLFKVHPDFDPLLGEILRRDPRGRVVFVDAPAAEMSEQLNSRFERTLPDVVDRIVFLPRLDEADYFNLLASADVLLDTIHFGGGSTTYESLALGTPVVTWPGAFARSRVTAACYERMGIADAVAGSAGEYVEIALRIAGDHKWREQLRARIARASDVIFEDVSAVRSLEEFFLRAATQAPGASSTAARGS